MSQVIGMVMSVSLLVEAFLNYKRPDLLVGFCALSYIVSKLNERAVR